jgi:V-type H+-transporting ATPase subunit H
MSLAPPAYLASTQNNIRTRPIPWEGAVRTGHISEDDLKKIKDVDKVRREPRRQAVERDLDGYVTLLSGTGDQSIWSSGRADVIQYMLVLSGDLINGKLYRSNGSYPY